MKFCLSPKSLMLMKKFTKCLKFLKLPCTSINFSENWACYLGGIKGGDGAQTECDHRRPFKHLVWHGRRDDLHRWCDRVGSSWVGNVLLLLTWRLLRTEMRCVDARGISESVLSQLWSFDPWLENEHMNDMGSVGDTSELVASANLNDKSQCNI